MGIKIYYKGSLNVNKIESIDSIRKDLIDISIKMGWKYELINGNFNKKKTATITYDHSKNKTTIDGDLPLKGITIFCDPNCESVPFIFDKKGYLREILIFAHFNEDQLENTHVGVKTQYAPLDIHISIIKILKYLKSKYISNLEVVDEGDYWETENEKVLKANLNYLSSKIDMVGEVLSDIKIDPANDDIDDTVEQIERLIDKKLSQSKTKLN